MSHVHPGQIAALPRTTATVVGGIMVTPVGVWRCGPSGLFPHLGLPAAFPRASDSPGSVANWSARTGQ